jgi:peptidoglycan L-alanyl-D-glutamate endopeptidase CwlK
MPTPAEINRRWQQFFSDNNLDAVFVKKIRALKKAADAERIHLWPYEGVRSPERQARLYRVNRPIDEIRRKAAALYARGFPRLGALLMSVGPQLDAPDYPGHRTHAGPGESMHQFGRALDCAPVNPNDGSLVWSATSRLWLAYGRAARSARLEWAGDWETFQEFPHVQLAAGAGGNALTAMQAAGWSAAAIDDYLVPGSIPGSIPVA